MEEMNELDELRAEVAALKAELKLTRGELKTVLHNTEAARLKAEQARARYEAWMAEPRDASLKREIELAKASRDFWCDKCKELSATVEGIVMLARGRGRYEVREKVGE